MYNPQPSFETIRKRCAIHRYFTTNIVECARKHYLQNTHQAPAPSLSIPCGWSAACSIKTIPLRAHLTCYKSNPTVSSTRTHELCTDAHANPNPMNIYNGQNARELNVHRRRYSRSETSTGALKNSTSTDSALQSLQLAQNSAQRNH